MKPFARTILFAAAVTLFASFVTAQERREVPELKIFGEPASAADAAAIGRLVDEYKKFWGEQNVSAFERLHAADVEWVNAYARIVRGAKPLGAFLEERLFPAFDPAVSKQEADNLETISIRYIGSDAAVIHMYTEGSRGPSRNAGEALRRTHVHLVLEKQTAGWKVVHTAIMDAR